MTVGKSIIRQAGRTVVVRETASSTTVTAPAHTAVIQVTGVPGPPGPEGPQGPPGSGGGGGGSGSYTYIQSVPSAFWTITHNLGYYPAVMVWDTANDMIQADVDHISPSQLTIGFNTAISGRAYMS